MATSLELWDSDLYEIVGVGVGQVELVFEGGEGWSLVAGFGKDGGRGKSVTVVAGDVEVTVLVGAGPGRIELVVEDSEGWSLMSSGLLCVNALIGGGGVVQLDDREQIVGASPGQVDLIVECCYPWCLR